nr:retrovirus-related Pol polyprotein from transposon TNT 1-94 [Tanacetum cinerariifolium]
MTPLTSSSGLVPNLVSQQPCIPPNKDDWDHLFQPMFDEYFNPLTIVVSPIPVAAAPRAVDLAYSHVSTSIDQDAPSTSIPSIQEQEHSLKISQGFKESPKTPTFHDDPLYESLHEDSTSQGSSLNMRQAHTSFESLGRWTKDHPIANVIGNPSRSISTRKQLQTDVMWCNGSHTLHTKSRKQLNNAEFKMSMMRQISFFLGLQISQSPRGIFINQSKYASEIVKKYGMLTSDFVDTPMVEKSNLDKDLQEKPVDATQYCGILGSLMYLTSSRPDLIYDGCLCAWYQEKPTEKHLSPVKRIF